MKRETRRRLAWTNLGERPVFVLVSDDFDVDVGVLRSDQQVQGKLGVGSCRCTGTHNLSFCL